MPATEKQSKYKRILLKLSGEALMGDENFGIDPKVLDRMALEIGQLVGIGVQVGIVIGGGNLFRGAALSAAGMPSNSFIFEGFLPAKSLARRQQVEVIADETRTVIFYESTHRIVASLKDMMTVLGADRYVVIARELTKTFETIHGAPLGDLIEWIEQDHNQQKGEFVVLVSGAPEKEDTGFSSETLRTLDILLQELPMKQASALTAKLTGEKKNALYQVALERKG